MTWNQGLFEATKTALEKGGAGSELAEAAAIIVARDDPNETNLGRSSKDQTIIQAAHPYLLNAIREQDNG